ncbi:MAG: hypothetical protein ACODAU_09585 [Myxococcota bacterium]
MGWQVAEDGTRTLPWLALAVLIGCTGPAPAVDGEGGRHEPFGGDGGACADPSPGCPCAPGSEPVSCYAEPESVPGGLYCREGRMHCRDGAWSACETVRTFTLDRSHLALVTDPVVCNPCNPDCFETTDRPDDGDLTPDNSSNVVHDPNEGGVTIEEEPVDSTLPDSDGDGLPDLGEDVVADGGFFHVLPYGGDSAIDPMDIEVEVTTADVYFLIDDSGSMDGEIANLQSDLTSGELVAGCPGGLIGAIRCTIPNAWVGVGSFEEYPEYPYGVSSNDVYVHHQDLTDDTSAAQAAVNGLSVGGNYSWPESATQALHAMATGEGLGPYLGSRSGCPADHWGYGCFRPDTIPIAVLITDAPFHNGPNPSHDYDITEFERGEYALPRTSTPLTNLDARPSVGVVTDDWQAFTGDTTGLTNTWSGWGCGAGNSPDGLFYFQTTEWGYVRFTSEGTSFDSVFGVVDRVRGRLHCDNDDPGMGDTAMMDVYLPPGLHAVIIDGEGNNESGPFQMNIGTTIEPRWPDTVQALNARGFKVIVIESSEGYSDAYENSVALANATGSLDQDGSPYVFSIGTDGSGTSGAVVDAIERLANATRFDVSVRAADPSPDGDEEDGPDNGVDETGFVASIAPIGWTAGSCDRTTANGFSQCTPGTQLDMQVEFRNDFVQPTSVPQVFDFELEVLLDGTIQERIPVRIVVPADVPTYPDPGYYHRDYDASLTCDVPTERPDWGELSWEVSAPSDTAVRFELRTAADVDDLASATAATFTIPADEPEVGSLDVTQVLLDAGQPINDAALRVTAVLLPSNDELDAPVLHGFDFQYNCVAGE